MTQQHNTSASGANVSRRAALSALSGGLVLGASAWAQAQIPSPQTREPLYRVSNAPKTAPQPQGHPLDAALDLARVGLKRMREGDPQRRLPPVRDYTATLIKRERIKGVLGNYEYMFCKVRNRQMQDGRIVVPFGVYMYFLKPEKIKGREVVYVEGKNNNKLCAHEGGGQTWLPTVWLKPAGSFAMKGQLYPLTDVGLENLVIKLIERGTAERRFPDCQVDFLRGVTVNKRRCTLLRVMHPTKRPEFEFSKAEIFVDDEMQVPMRYVAYDWPKPGEAVGEVLEEYTYVNITLNPQPGLTDKDFDPYNSDYNFYKKK